MPVINGENREKKLNFDEKHRFIKGNTVSKGRRKRTQIDKSIEIDRSFEQNLKISQRDHSGKILQALA